MFKQLWKIVLFSLLAINNVDAADNKPAANKISPDKPAADKAIVLTINNAINSATVHYIQRGFAYAQQQNAKLIIINLNTSGGHETSMRGIADLIASSSVPVISYVPPNSTSTASGGTFILYASQIAAMAPGTNIGSVAPADFNPRSKAPIAGQLNKNDTASYIRSLAQLRGRNAAWAEAAVLRSASATAAEAENLHVINFIAKDLQELLIKSDKRTISVGGKKTKLTTANLTLEMVEQDDNIGRTLVAITSITLLFFFALLSLAYCLQRKNILGY